MAFSLGTRFVGCSLRTDQFPGKGAIQAGRKLNYGEFKATVLYYFTMRSFSKLIQMKENTDHTIPHIIENLSQSQKFKN